MGWIDVGFTMPMVLRPLNDGEKDLMCVCLSLFFVLYILSVSKV